MGPILLEIAGISCLDIVGYPGIQFYPIPAHLKDALTCQDLVDSLRFGDDIKGNVHVIAVPVSVEHHLLAFLSELDLKYK